MFVNLKKDLTEAVEKKLYYAKVNLTRLAASADGNVSYEDKLLEIEDVIREIVLLETELNSISQYFQDTVPVEQQKQMVQQPQPNGATHAE